jgi:hypothetical protein
LKRLPEATAVKDEYGADEALLEAKAEYSHFLMSCRISHRASGFKTQDR